MTSERSLLILCSDSNFLRSLRENKLTLSVFSICRCKNRKLIRKIQSSSPFQTVAKTNFDKKIMKINIDAKECYFILGDNLCGCHPLSSRVEQRVILCLKKQKPPSVHRWRLLRVRDSRIRGGSRRRGLLRQPPSPLRSSSGVHGSCGRSRGPWRPACGPASARRASP